MTLVDLAALDNLPPIEPDPAVRTSNLAALRAASPALADQLVSVVIPPDWKLVRTLDDWPTWRIEQPDVPPAWPGGSATPTVRATALLDFETLRGKNPALAGVGAGATLDRLLKTLSPRQAVFVFESDPVRLAAVLHVVDVSAALAAGRCILLPGGSEQATLEDLLTRRPGLLPPGSIIALPGVAPERLGRIRSVCETVARGVSAQRHARLKALAESSGRNQPAADRACLAVLALTDTPTHHDLAETVHEAAHGLGWETVCRVARSPDDVFPLPHCEALVECAPALTLSVGADPHALPVLPPGRRCWWHLAARDVPDSIAASDTMHLAATPRIARLLREAGVPAERIADFWWACPEPDRPARLDGSGATEAGRPIASVVIVGDLPDASAAACGVVQPTHVQLWSAVRARAEDACATRDIYQPAALLRHAERTSGVSLREAALRRQMLRIVEYVLIPTVVLERIFRWLVPQDCTVYVSGAGWERVVSDTSRILTNDPRAWRARGLSPRDTATVFAGQTDPLGATLLAAGGGGWPILLHSPGSDSLAGALGGILHPGQHFVPFAGRRDLLDGLETMRRDPAAVRKRTTRLRAYLHREHRMASRLTTLVRSLGLNWAEGA